MCLVCFFVVLINFDWKFCVCVLNVINEDKIKVVFIIYKFYLEK